MPKANDDTSTLNQMTECQKQIEPVVAKLREALNRASRLSATASDDERESAEAEICLRSRSAYFDFYTWVVLKGEIDEPAARELDILFQLSLATMRIEEFKQSVSERYVEFKDKCDHVRQGDPSSQLASSIDD